MSGRPERPGPSPAPQPRDPTSAATAPSVLGHDASRLANARSALSECFGAISLVQVTVHSLEAQDIACAEQDVLNRAIQALWSVHDWINDRTWPEITAEHGRDRESPHETR